MMNCNTCGRSHNRCDCGNLDCGRRRARLVPCDEEGRATCSVCSREVATLEEITDLKDCFVYVEENNSTYYMDANSNPVVISKDLAFTDKIDLVNNNYCGQAVMERSSGMIYVFDQSGTIVATSNGIPDVPNDGKQYVRSYMEWVESAGGGLTPETLMTLMDPTISTIVDGKITLINKYLPLSGGTMTGDVEFDGHRITNANINGVTNG